MKRPYFASRNHSRRFSRAASGATPPGCWASPSTPMLERISEATKTRKHENFIGCLEAEPRRQLNLPWRRGRRIDAVSRAERRLRLLAGSVEDRGAIDVDE